MARRSDSRVHKIAAELRQQDGVATVSRLRAPRGTMVGHYAMPAAGKSNQGAAVTASAQVIFGSSVSARLKRAQPQSWQAESWELRREIGEFRFAGDRPARALSQVRIFVAELPDEHDKEPIPVTTGPLADLNREMFGNQAAVQQGLKFAGQHLSFNGESNFVIRQHPDTGRMSWSAHSVSEVMGSGTSFKLDDGVDPIELTENDLVVRCWTPDPEKSGLADCPARAVLPVARELRGLTQHTSAQIDSRLAGAGMLMVPDNIEVLGGQISDADPDSPDADMDQFVRALVESMTVPLQQRDSAASIVPLVVKLPAEVIDKIKHITFGGPIDVMAKDMREESIRRVALGMDSDPSVLLGVGGTNHWSAWLVSEEEVQLVVAPNAATVCHAFTVGWLRPVCEQLQLDPTRYIVWFDTSTLELRPDKSADAQALHAADLVSDALVLKENGFNPVADAPTDEERERRILTRLLLAKPDYAPQILPKLGIILELAPAGEPTDPVVVDAPVVEPVEDGLDRDIPAMPDGPPDEDGPPAL
jgi:hypothetical protein